MEESRNGQENGKNIMDRSYEFKKDLYSDIIQQIIIWLNLFRDFDLAVEETYFLSQHQGSIPTMHVCHPPRCLTCSLDLQDVQWIRGLIIVHASWHGHPNNNNKKKNSWQSRENTLIYREEHARTPRHFISRFQPIQVLKK